MEFIPIKTRAFLPPRDNLLELLGEELGQPGRRLRNGDVLFITSKVLAIHQGRTVKIPANKRAAQELKNELIKREAEAWLPPGKVAGHEFYLTIKEHTLIPSAGIDESNADGYYVLWPRNVNVLLKTIRARFMKQYKLKNLGVVATDSHTQPLRTGVTGISVGLVGFEPLRDYRNKKDVFGRQLKYTQANIADALSAMAVLLMGEGSERTPLLILRGAKFLKFTNKPTHQKLFFPAKKDLYYPLLKPFYERTAKSKRRPALRRHRRHKH